MIYVIFLPSHALIIISCKMSKCARSHICSPIGCFHCVAVNHSHVPKNDSSSSFFLALNGKTACRQKWLLRKSRRNLKYDIRYISMVLLNLATIYFMCTYSHQKRISRQYFCEALMGRLVLLEIYRYAVDSHNHTWIYWTFWKREKRRI